MSSASIDVVTSKKISKPTAQNADKMLSSTPSIAFPLSISSQALQLKTFQSPHRLSSPHEPSPNNVKTNQLSTVAQPRNPQSSSPKASSYLLPPTLALDPLCRTNPFPQTHRHPRHLPPLPPRPPPRHHPLPFPPPSTNHQNPLLSPQPRLRIRPPPLRRLHLERRRRPRARPDRLTMPQPAHRPGRRLAPSRRHLLRPTGHGVADDLVLPHPDSDRLLRRGARPRIYDAVPVRQTSDRLPTADPGSDAGIEHLHRRSDRRR